MNDPCSCKCLMFAASALSAPCWTEALNPSTSKALLLGLFYKITTAASEIRNFTCFLETQGGDYTDCEFGNSLQFDWVFSLLIAVFSREQRDGSVLITSSQTVLILKLHTDAGGLSPRSYIYPLHAHQRKHALLQGCTLLAAHSNTSSTHERTMSKTMPVPCYETPEGVDIRGRYDPEFASVLTRDRKSVV